MLLLCVYARERERECGGKRKEGGGRGGKRESERVRVRESQREREREGGRERESMERLLALYLPAVTVEDELHRKQSNHKALNEVKEMVHH